MRAVLSLCTLVLAALASVSACASSSRDERMGGRGDRRTVRVEGPSTVELVYYPDRRSVTDQFSVPRDSLWNALVVAYRELELPINDLDERAFRIGTGSFTAIRRIGAASAERYLECGSSGGGITRASTYELRVAVASMLHPVDGGTQLETLVNAYAKPQGMSGDPVQCSSNGRLEAAIAEALHRHVER
ncbi:MAG TPA: hypothetical protein VFY16_13680 [Gemmatimonadaceae bacterium]|nr:hypothetical protein [Gemmatimonadaceae bacterium]